MTGKTPRHPPRPSSRQHDHSRARARPDCPIRHGYGERLLVDILSVGEHLAVSSDMQSNTETPSGLVRDGQRSGDAKPTLSAEPGTGRGHPASAEAGSRQELPGSQDDRPEVFVPRKGHLEREMEH